MKVKLLFSVKRNCFGFQAASVNLVIGDNLSSSGPTLLWIGGTVAMRFSILDSEYELSIKCVDEDIGSVTIHILFQGDTTEFKATDGMSIEIPVEVSVNFNKAQEGQ